MINNVVLAGRLTRDPEVRYTTNGTKVANFSLAVERQFKTANGERETDFFDCVAWQKSADLAEQYLTKGRITGVTGRLQNRSFDATDGTKRRVTEVVVEHISFFPEGRKNGDGSAPATDEAMPPDDLPF